jgi:hypothetical protein
VFAWVRLRKLLFCLSVFGENECNLRRFFSRRLAGKGQRDVMAGSAADFTFTAEKSRPRADLSRSCHEAVPRWVDRKPREFVMTGNEYLQDYRAIKVQIGTELSHKNWRAMPRLLDALDSLRLQHARQMKQSLDGPHSNEQEARFGKNASVRDQPDAKKPASRPFLWTLFRW